jgi:hypothetical protein
MFQHQGAIFRGAFDTKECRSNTPTYSCKTLNIKTPNHIKLTTINHNVASERPPEDGRLVLKHVGVFNITYEFILSNA